MRHWTDHKKKMKKREFQSSNKSIKKVYAAHSKRVLTWRRTGGHWWKIVSVQKLNQEWLQLQCSQCHCRPETRKIWEFKNSCLHLQDTILKTWIYDSYPYSSHEWALKSQCSRALSCTHQLTKARMTIIVDQPDKVHMHHLRLLQHNSIVFWVFKNKVIRGMTKAESQYLIFLLINKNLWNS